MSLKSKLNEAIKQKGYMSFDEVKRYTEELGYKLSNAERRLRRSESPNLERVMKKGAIVGYKWINKPDIFVDMGITDKPTKPTFGSTADIYKLRRKR